MACQLTDGERKEGDFVCMDAKYLRGKSAGDHFTRGRFVGTGCNMILVDGENSGEVGICVAATWASRSTPCL